MTDVHTVIKGLVERGWGAPTLQEDGTFRLYAKTPFWVETGDENDEDPISVIAMIDLNPETEIGILMNEQGVTQFKFGEVS